MVHINAGRNLRVLRVKMGLTQAMLAEELGVSSNFISAIETGTKKGTIVFYIDAANFFDVSLDYFFGDDLKCKESLAMKSVLLKMSYRREGVKNCFCMKKLS